MNELHRTQPRFFCENCKRELFLEARYCDGCGGRIEWPEKYKSFLKESKSSIPE